jgi:REP-associated tyrosine transposase
MGRPRRVTVGGIVYHVLNRANRRTRIFHKPGDYDAFLQVLAEGLQIVPCRLLALCLMPNHWHLVLWPTQDGQLSHLMAWITNTHVKRYRHHYHDRIGGHLYQGRFKSFPVQEDSHLLTVLRYVEANPLRARLAQHPANWPWCSFALRAATAPLPSGLRLSDWPLPQPTDWDQIVQTRWTPEELNPLRLCLSRGRPFGQSTWVDQTARQLGLHATLRPPGRPPILVKTVAGTIS